MIVQDLAGGTPSQRSSLNTLMRSCSYLILFVGRRTKPIARSIASWYFSGEKFRLTEPFDFILSNPGKHSSYIVIDFVNCDPKYVVRQQGLIPRDDCFIFDFPQDIKTPGYVDTLVSKKT